MGKPAPLLLFKGARSDHPHRGVAPSGSYAPEARQKPTRHPPVILRLLQLGLDPGREDVAPATLRALRTPELSWGAILNGVRLLTQA